MHLQAACQCQQNLKNNGQTTARHWAYKVCVEQSGFEASFQPVVLGILWKLIMNAQILAQQKDELKSVHTQNNNPKRRAPGPKLAFMATLSITYLIFWIQVRSLTHENT